MLNMKTAKIERDLVKNYSKFNEIFKCFSKPNKVEQLKFIVWIFNKIDSTLLLQLSKH